MKRIIKEFKIIIITWLMLSLIGIAIWIFKSHFEAKVYTELTGKHVTTTQAMFIQLRVIEPAIQNSN
jgi:hypothetical protein